MTESSEPIEEIHCGRCAGVTKHDVVAKYKGEVGEWDSVYYDNYSVVKCRGCGSISFMREYLLVDDVSLDHEGETVANPTRFLYPKKNNGIRPMEDLRELPENLKAIYRETVDALHNDLYVLAAMGIRTILEAVCNDNNVNGRSLNEQIDGLQNAGLVTKTGAEILHSLRFMGNQAAHEVKVHKLDELFAALKVIDHLLIGVYTIPKLAKKLPQIKPQS